MSTLRHDTAGIGRRVASVAALSLVALLPPAAAAAVSDVRASDVTTRAAALVWLSDAPVDAATIRVFTDADGTDEITEALTVNVVSAGFSPAHDLGLVKIEALGLDAGTTYYFQTETTAGGATVLEPAVAPFLPVTTAAATRKIDDLGETIVNDLVAVATTAPDETSSADGSLVLVDAPGIAAVPVSAFVGEGAFDPLTVVADLNNLFDANGASAALADGQVLRIVHYRGSLCPDPAEQQQVRYRRVPAQAEFPRVVGLETADACFAADLACDDVVDQADVAALLDGFGSVSGDCRHNPDADIVDDGIINVLDMQSILNHFGEAAPF